MPIYLERKAALPPGSGFQHFYLVERDDSWTSVEHPTQEQLDTLNLSSVVSGTSGTIPISGLSDLIVHTKTIGESDDKYSFDRLPSDSKSINVTSLLNKPIAELQGFAAGINVANFEYQIASVFFGGAISNSNAVMFSVFNFAGIDLREALSNSGFPIPADYPGGGAGATLLGSTAGPTPEIIEASSALKAGVNIQGRDDVNDYMIGTKFSDTFYGEQDVAGDTTNDTVSFETSDQALTLTYNITPVIGNSLNANFSSDCTDTLIGIENIVGTNFADVFNINSEDTSIFVGGKGGGSF